MFNMVLKVSYRSDLVLFEWCESWAHAGSKIDDNIFSLPHFTLAKYEHKVCNGIMLSLVRHRINIKTIPVL